MVDTVLLDVVVTVVVVVVVVVDGTPDGASMSISISETVIVLAANPWTFTTRSARSASGLSIVVQYWPARVSHVLVTVFCTITGMPACTTPMYGVILTYASVSVLRILTIILTRPAVPK